MENLSKILFILLFLNSCTLTQYAYDPIYEDHPHTTEVYYNGIDIYFGYYSGFYYYYGVPHFYPWWYYYQFIPPYYFHTHTHVYVQCDNGYYVYGHRGPLFHNVGPSCKINNGKFIPSVKYKNKNDKSFVFPRDWKSHNSTKNTKQDNWWNKVNINKTDYNRNFNYRNSHKINHKHNNTININKNNKINKGNNGSTRPNKTRINQKKKR